MTKCSTYSFTPVVTSLICWHDDKQTILLFDYTVSVRFHFVSWGGSSHTIGTAFATVLGKRSLEKLALVGCGGEILHVLPRDNCSITQSINEVILVSMTDLIVFDFPCWLYVSQVCLSFAN